MASCRDLNVDARRVLSMRLRCIPTFVVPSCWCCPHLGLSCDSVPRIRRIEVPSLLRVVRSRSCPSSRCCWHLWTSVPISAIRTAFVSVGGFRCRPESLSDDRLEALDLFLFALSDAVPARTIVGRCGGGQQEGTISREGAGHQLLRQIHASSDSHTEDRKVSR